ncbi:MAG: anthranilate phosphoribosyltransferase, partial [Desulfocapsaceae bacterium]|nr:anthranilate phosphoribosyltransferase [Desulfocapsaceae bacterium]
MDIKQAITKVVSHQDLSEDEMVDVMNEIMGGSATQAQIGS